MEHVLFRLRIYLLHSIKSFKSKHGYGVHSPFAFSFICDIINPKTSGRFYCYEIIEQLRDSLLNDNNKIVLDNGKTSTIKRIAKKSVSPKGDGQLLFRIALFMHSKNIIELGTSLGIGTAYLASANKQAKVISIDHNTAIQGIAKQNAKKIKINNITFVNNAFNDALDTILEKMSSPDLVFFDGHHKGDATLNYFDKVRKKSHAQSVFVFHDIHWSKDMYLSWKTIKKHQNITLSIECHNIGIVFFNPIFNKQHFYA